MERDFSLSRFVDLVDHVCVDLDLRNTAVGLVDLHRVTPIVLDFDAELRPLDSERCVLRYEDRVAAGVVEVQACRENPMVSFQFSVLAQRMLRL